MSKYMSKICDLVPFWVRNVFYEHDIIVLQQMGSADSRLYKPPTLKKQSWREGRQRRQSRPQQGRYRVLVNNLTNEQLQEYLLSFQTLPEFQRYLEFFQWREREDCIVNTKYLNYELGRDFCNTSYTARVYVERIPVRLSDIEDIPFPENLYLLLSALDGFEKLYRSLGYFRPTEDLICMDRDGRVKAWLNPDLSRCLPGAPSENARKDDGLQASMVDEIVRMVQENTARDQQPEVSVREYMWRNQRAMTFKQAKLEVLAYAEHFHTEIPNYFQSVVGIFDETGNQDEEQVSVQPPPLPKNQDEYNHIQGEVRGGNEADQVWQQNYTRQPQQQQTLAQFHREKVYAHLPPLNIEQRPQSTVYSQGTLHPAQQQSFNPSSPSAFSANAHPAFPPPSSSHEFRSTHSNPHFRVKFNYQGHPHFHSQISNPNPILAPPPQLSPNPLSPITQLSSPTHPLALRRVASIPQESEQKIDSRMMLSSSLKNLLSQNNKLVYSDSTSTYELDSELAQDMVRYLNEA